MKYTDTPRRRKSVGSVLAGCLACIYPPRWQNACSLAMDSFFTHWMSRQFEQLGNKVLLRRPLNVVGAGNMRIGDASTVGKGSTLSAWKTTGLAMKGLIIGHDTHIGEYAHITCAHHIVIGNHVLTGRWITITDNAHGEFTAAMLECPPIERPITSKGAVIIGDKVWLGDKVTILSGVTIGDQAIVGANAVVTSDVPSRAIVAGNPARIIKVLED